MPGARHKRRGRLTVSTWVMIVAAAVVLGCIAKVAYDYYPTVSPRRDIVLQQAQQSVEARPTPSVTPVPVPATPTKQTSSRPASSVAKSPKAQLEQVLGSVAPATSIKKGGVIGVLKIPALGKKYEQPILQGTADAQLAAGVGHVLYTALPGELGNFYVAGHNLPWGGAFHNLKGLGTGFTAIVETKQATYVYKMDRTMKVLPTNIRPTAPIPGHAMHTKPDWAYLSLQTCTPVYNPVYRYIVSGKLVKVLSKKGNVVWSK